MHTFISFFFSFFQKNLFSTDSLVDFSYFSLLCFNFVAIVRFISAFHIVFCVIYCKKSCFNHDKAINFFPFYSLFVHCVLFYFVCHRQKAETVKRSFNLSSLNCANKIMKMVHFCSCIVLDTNKYVH